MTECRKGQQAIGTTHLVLRTLEVEVTWFADGTCDRFQGNGAGAQKGCNLCQDLRASADSLMERLVLVFSVFFSVSITR